MLGPEHEFLVFLSIFKVVECSLSMKCPKIGKMQFPIA